MAIFSSGEVPQHFLRKPIITIGTFDGVHLGHRLILDEVKRHAQAIGGESMVITFEPHPRQVLQPDVPLRILTPLSQKLDLITATGIDHIAVTPFTKEFAQQSANEYIRDFLVKNFHPAAIVIGYDHHFGHDREGNISFLKNYSATFGYDVHEIPAHMVREAAISSTRIRTDLLNGDVLSAAQMLGRPYSISGKVVKGQQLGRTIGYPTINVQPDDAAQLIPAQGIYAIRVTVKGQQYDSMLSIGTRPTVTDDGSITIEANLFDFSNDIYGEEVEIHFIQRTRDELKFESLEALKTALAADEVETREILNRK